MQEKVKSPSNPWASFRPGYMEVLKALQEEDLYNSTDPASMLTLRRESLTSNERNCASSNMDISPNLTHTREMNRIEGGIGEITLVNAGGAS